MKSNVVEIDSSYTIKEPESLTKLKLMTEGMAPSLDAFACTKTDVIEYDMERGTAIAFGLWKQTEVAVARVFFSAGALFPEQTLEEHQARNSEYLMDFDAWIMLAGIGIVIAALIYTAMVT